MTDDFRPGSQFRRSVDQRTWQIRRRRHLLVATAATVVAGLAVAVPVYLTSGDARSTVNVLTSPNTVPETTAAPTTSTARPPAQPSPSPANPATAPLTTAPPGTHVITYDPFSAEGAIRQGLHVTKVVNGSCNSSGVAGNYSYRCLAGSTIYDPCFAHPSATSGPVVCPTNPSTPNLIQLNTGPLPTPATGLPGKRVWATQLADGQICTQINAAWGGLGPFSCQPSPSRPLADCHVPKQANPWWAAECQTQLNTNSPFSPYRVVTVWL